jgi:hypothetical protein
MVENKSKVEQIPRTKVRFTLTSLSVFQNHRGQQIKKKL